LVKWSVKARRVDDKRVVGLAVAAVVLLVGGLAYWLAGAGGGDTGPAAGATGSGGWVGSVPDGLRVAKPSRPSTPPLVQVTGATAVDYLGSVEVGNQPVEFVADAATGPIPGTVKDAAGADLGPGTLRLGAGPAALAALGIVIDGQLDADAGGVTITAATIRVVAGDLTVGGHGLVFQPNTPAGKPTPPSRNLGDTTVTVTNPGVTVDLGGAKRWENAPAYLILSSRERSSLSWAGGLGRVLGVNGRPITATGTLGLKADGLTVELSRSPQGIDLAGEGRVRQVYADGLPRLQAKGRVDIKRPPNPTAPGSKGQFTWAPTNTTDYDLAISRIRPANEHAKWVNLALDQLPMMCGRPTCDRLGGNTDGLGRAGSGGFLTGGAKRTNAVILPRTGDERSISFDVPTGTPPGDYNLVLVLEGNFAPITVTVPVKVA
jgi:hypothetical protein